MSFTIAGAVVGIAGAAYGVYAGEKAAGQAKKAGRAQAATEQAVTDERLVQIQREAMLTREEQVAGAAASGIKTSSVSTLQVMADTAAQFAREQAITKRVGASAVKSALQEGKIVGQQYRAQGIGQAAQGMSNVFNILGGLK